MSRHQCKAKCTIAICGVCARIRIENDDEFLICVLSHFSTCSAQSFSHSLIKSTALLLISCVRAHHFLNQDSSYPTIIFYLNCLLVLLNWLPSYKRCKVINFTFKHINYTYASGSELYAELILRHPCLFYCSVFVYFFLLYLWLDLQLIHSIETVGRSSASEEWKRAPTWRMAWLMKICAHNLFVMCCLLFFFHEL